MAEKDAPDEAIQYIHARSRVIPIQSRRPGMNAAAL